MAGQRYARSSAPVGNCVSTIYQYIALVGEGPHRPLPLLFLSVVQAAAGQVATIVIMALVACSKTIKRRTIA